MPSSGSTSRSGDSSAALRSRAEDLQVGVAKAVDRLVLVADHQRPRVRPLQCADEAKLDRVGVLELVDHHVCEALAPGARQPRARVEQLERPQLEVLKVERRPRLLQRSVAAVEALEQQLEARRADRAAASSSVVSARSSSFRLGECTGSSTSGSRGSIIPWLRSRVCASSVICTNRQG